MVINTERWYELSAHSSQKASLDAAHALSVTLTEIGTEGYVFKTKYTVKWSCCFFKQPTISTQCPLTGVLREAFSKQNLSVLSGGSCERDHGHLSPKGQLKIWIHAVWKRAFPPRGMGTPTSLSWFLLCVCTRRLKQSSDRVVVAGIRVFTSSVISYMLFRRSISMLHAAASSNDITVQPVKTFDQHISSGS